MAITETRTLPAEYIEALGKTYAADLTRQAGIPSITTADTQQAGETAAQFAQRQAQAQQFGITKAGMAGLAPQVAPQDQLQTDAYNLGTAGLGSFQPFLTKATTAADAATGLTGALTGAQLATKDAEGNVITPDVVAGSYMSPYQSSVIDTTLTEFDRQAKAQKAQQAAQTLGIPGAFGGGREGVLQAEYASSSDRNRAALQAGLLQQGFQQAQQARQQDFVNQSGLTNLQSGLGGISQDFSRAQISGLGTLGAQQQAQNQAILDAQTQANQMAVQDPINRLNLLGSGTIGLMGGSADRTTIGEAPQAGGSSPLANALGLGLVGSSIYGNLIKKG